VLTSSNRLVCSCPRRVEESLVCCHIISVCGSTHPGFINIRYNKNYPVKFMTGDEAYDQNCLQQVCLPGFPASPEFAQKILGESHFSHKFGDEASRSTFDTVLKSAQPVLRNPNCLDGLDLGGGDNSESDDIVPCCSVVASVGGKVTEEKLVALSQSLPIEQQPVVKRQSEHEDMSNSRPWNEMGSQRQQLANITNNEEIVRKMLFVKMEGLVGWAQQMVADPVAAKREWEEMSSTMSLSSGTMLNKTEDLEEDPVGKKCRFVSSNLAIDKRETAARKKPWCKQVWHNVERK